MSTTQQVWFTSDTHFGHANIIRYSNRPYQDKEEMDEALITNWNAKVQPGDLVYHLGDVFFCHEPVAGKILARLNGQKFLIFGNHDKGLKNGMLKHLFTWMGDYKEITVEGQKIILCHYPMITWNGSGRGSWMLHGHCHGNLTYPFEAKIHDVGVDPNGYSPLSFADVKRIMDKKKMTVVDHHGRD